MSMPIIQHFRSWLQNEFEAILSNIKVSHWTVNLLLPKQGNKDIARNDGIKKTKIQQGQTLKFHIWRLELFGGLT